MGICGRNRRGPRSEVRGQRETLWPWLLTLGVCLAVPPIAIAQTPPAKAAEPWVVPRTPDGKPDLQGNWTNATLTPIERPRDMPRALTRAQVVAWEKIRNDSIVQKGQKSDPDRPAPPVGGDGSTGAAGNVGGYNYFWIDAGDHIAVVNTEWRSSLIVDPEDGRLPPLTPAARAWAAERAAEDRKSVV